MRQVSFSSTAPKISPNRNTGRTVGWSVDSVLWQVFDLLLHTKIDPARKTQSQETVRRKSYRRPKSYTPPSCKLRLVWHCWTRAVWPRRNLLSRCHEFGWLFHSTNKGPFCQKKQTIFDCLKSCRTFPVPNFIHWHTTRSQPGENTPRGQVSFVFCVWKFLLFVHSGDTFPMWLWNTHLLWDVHRFLEVSKRTRSLPFSDVECSWQKCIEALFFPWKIEHTSHSRNQCGCQTTGQTKRHIFHVEHSATDLKISHALANLWSPEDQAANSWRKICLSLLSTFAQDLDHWRIAQDLLPNPQTLFRLTFHWVRSPVL